MEENCLHFALTMFSDSSRTMLHVTRTGYSRCGWRRIGKPTLQTWTSKVVIKSKLDGQKPSNKSELINICARSPGGEGHPQTSVKDWWRAKQEAWKLWLNVRVIPLNLDVNIEVCVCVKSDMAFYVVHHIVGHMSANSKAQHNIHRIKTHHITSESPLLFLHICFLLHHSSRSLGWLNISIVHISTSMF